MALINVSATRFLLFALAVAPLPIFCLINPYLKAHPLVDHKQILETESEGQLKQAYYETVIGTDVSSDIRRLTKARARGKVQPFYSKPFPCKNTSWFKSPIRPTSVHKLMPGDIQVVAAMGDSLTSGTGATAISMFDTLIENRGFSWSVGGFGTWRDTLTVPNILRIYNPHLVGYSVRTTTSVDGRVGGAAFNVAEAGALSRHMLYQAKVLVERIRGSDSVDFYRDWKLVTLMVGNNDICSEMCYLKNPNIIVDVHYWSIRDALDYLRDNLPRTFVNVVPTSKVAYLPSVRFPNSCYLTHTIFCSCIFGPKYRANREFYISISDRLQQATIDAVHDGGYSWKYETFAAVTQPYLVNSIFRFVATPANNFQPLDIMKFTSPDCFHYNQFGYAITANAMWNNMLQPIGQKHSMEPDEVFFHFHCPTFKHPYFFTGRNSKIVSQLKKKRN